MIDSTQRPLRILAVGPVVEGSTTTQRFHALRDLGHEIRVITTVKAEASETVRPSLLKRISHKLLDPRDLTCANAEILSVIRKSSVDIVWIDKGLTIRPETIVEVRRIQPACQIVGFSPDDMMNPGNQSKSFLRGLRLYHYYVTTKSYNVEELKKMGCPEVLFTDNGYDPHTHRPMVVGAEEKHRLGGSVGFIGQWEPDRAESLRRLGRADVPVRVWGYTWERMRDVPSSVQLENRPLWGGDYAKAICAFDINLCFLRKANRDRQTTRTMEIPACGAFMLAERTDDHIRLFDEGKEAEFFSSNDELLNKVRYYLGHGDERLRIARAGYERCLRCCYSNAERLQQVLERIRDNESEELQTPADTRCEMTDG
jgi:hypothetical protein